MTGKRRRFLEHHPACYRRLHLSKGHCLLSTASCLGSVRLGPIPFSLLIHFRFSL